MIAVSSPWKTSGYVEPMNPLLEWLKGGDLRSDGLSREVVRLVRKHPELIADLIQGLSVEEDVIRGRAADAIEHLAREIPQEVQAYQRVISRAANEDPTPMVRWHMAMVVGHLALDWDDPERANGLLLALLEDKSIFVVTWAIVSLCIYARLFPALRANTLKHIARHTSSPSVAIRSKVKKAREILSHDHLALPDGWVKSPKIRKELNRPST